MTPQSVLLLAFSVSLFTPGPVRAEQADVEWTTYDGVSIPVPPPEHPRLYLRRRDLTDLRRRTEHPATKPLWEELQRAARDEPALALETDALRYLLSRDADLGRRTAAAALTSLQETRFDMSRQDITRPIGRLMVVGAVVYDWCYPELTTDQKKAFVRQFVKFAGDLECGYPPPKTHAVTGHYSEWMLMRDMLSTGVAIYDEFPEMYQTAAQRFFSIFVPVRNWWYQGHAFHQGSAYAETRCSSELYPLWIFERLGAGAVYDPSLQFLPYQWIYMRRPDGQLLRSGDGQSKAPKLRSLLNASYYHDPYVLADYLRDPSIDRHSLLFALLWRDPDLQPRPVSDLPLSRYMGSPYGWMVARTGWDDDSVIAEMKVNVFNFNNHQHLDAGAFQVYYKGPLAVDSGLYSGTDGGYGSPHDVNYNKRTIAHNCLLVYDPSEEFRRGQRVMRNDGGQKFPNGWREPRSLEDMLANYRTGDVLGQGFGPDPRRPAYTYLKGDLARSYSAKVREARRSFVFLNLGAPPVRAALIVFDRVVAANPRFKKYWLLHSMEEPRIAGESITIALSERGWSGKLVDQVLLPDEASIAPVGGSDKQFWVFGENYPNEPRGGGSGRYEIGQWRVEVSPRRAAETNLFLNVMQVMDRDASSLPVGRIDEGDLIGAFIRDTSIFFQREGRLAEGPISLRSRGARFLVADLAQGTWRVVRNGDQVNPAAPVSGRSGVLWFEGPPGDYILQKRPPQ